MKFSLLLFALSYILKIAALTNKQFKNYISKAKVRILIKMLNAGRIDLWSYGEITAKWLLKSYGFNPEDYEMVYVLSETETHYAFHLDTPDSLIQKFQQTLDELKKQPADGGKSEYEKILEKYVK